MEQGMKQQRGAALVIVLALLAGALVVGISGMQSSLIDERLAGNYRASAQAQMNAEQAAGEAATLGSNKYSSMSEFTNSEESNWKKLGLDEDDWQDELKKLRYDLKKLEKMSGREENLCGEGENACFYFPLQVGSDNYMVAFGAVITEGKVISQHVVLVRLRGAISFPGPELEERFNEYGIIGGGQVDVEADQVFEFSGKIHSNEKIDDLDVTWADKKSGKTEKTPKIAIPSFAFASFLQDMKKRYSLDDDVSKDSGCNIESSRTLSSETQYCADQVDVNGSASIIDSTVYFDDEVDFKGGLVVRNSTLFFANDVDFNGSLEVHDSRLIAQGQVDINGAVSGSEITLVSHDQLDIFGSVHASDSVLYAGEKMDVFGSLKLTDSSIVVKDQLDTEGGLTLTNVAIVVDDEINITSKYGPVLNNVLNRPWFCRHLQALY